MCSLGLHCHLCEVQYLLLGSGTYIMGGQRFFLYLWINCVAKNYIRNLLWLISSSNKWNEMKKTKSPCIITKITPLQNKLLPRFLSKGNVWLFCANNNACWNRLMNLRLTKNTFIINCSWILIEFIQQKHKFVQDGAIPYCHQDATSLPKTASSERWIPQELRVATIISRL